MTSPTSPSKPSRTTQSIVLGDKLFPIPPLALGVQMKIVPLIMATGGRLAQLVGHPELLDEKTFSDLIAILHTAVSVQTANVSREEFEKIPATFQQMQDAMAIISAQAGLVVEAKKAGAPGEAKKLPTITK